MLLFEGFPKIPRFSREVIVTEKIDGTNAQILIGETGGFFTGSRKRWITPENDNHGFSSWAHEHKGELMRLGPGRHFGEWWGSGVQRGYGLPPGEKRFSLFNVLRWCPHDQDPQAIPTGNPNNGNNRMQESLPECVGLVPILWRGLFDQLDLNEILIDLRRNGSRAAPGFMRPEGVVVFHIAGRVGFKKTLEKDDVPKRTLTKAFAGL